ncbi:glycosyltransferase 87 family protein [Propionicimonas sp.]|uniref:glycosyltransferase family 87 protein n=1 Tax=Propionicimonas sp. TaxID=1955623 RepID=UPI0018177C3C|nr:glycosyltransferase 87 family protein [Propionicimonas sp.]MBU3975840.1 DUF2029 domain-containing protein [Actinomycetota bacterium]MBA3022172.1 DUF2029 domain-containing protein [Propionicimonas sp.]MBU3987390.1 DUF2029 domain-containing protein [Actinomycetota bacterium]MBU4006391.1 DUF2029 domain-containing protein [Actinomycetota bacterium]MBU4065270.1 DUF2029 domain-containing protein [Actinomycetota bacterium]
MNPDAPALSRLLGGRMGEHARPGGLWFRAWPWAFLILLVNFLVLMARQVPCETGQSKYLNLCYSDIRVLWYWRGLRDGEIPFLQHDVEYPVLTGAFMELGRRFVLLLGGKSQPGLNGAEVATSAHLFMGVTAVLVFALFGVLVWAHLKMHRPWDALMIASSPAILTAGLINWDALVIALTSLALLAWGRRQHVWAGIWLGLGIAAKLYPLLLLGPLFILALRTGKWREFFITAGATVATWVAVNLPVYLATPDGWLYFWTFNVDRGADLGSLWYALNLAGINIPELSRVESLAMVIGALAIAAILLFAPQRPRLAQGAFLIVALFLVVNKVYSPQYVLWLLPLLVLARPRWFDWAMFSIAETLYYLAIWAHLDGVLSQDVPAGRLYWLSVFFRVGVVLWLMSRVITDIYRPAEDPVRLTGLDDPDGGVFDNAFDAPWLQKLTQRGPRPARLASSPPEPEPAPAEPVPTQPEPTTLGLAESSPEPPRQ